MKQTAVEFLSENYMYVTWLTNRDEITSSEADKMRIMYLEQAKEMEKEQIIDFANDLLAQNDTNYIAMPDLAEQYYNETFKNK